MASKPTQPEEKKATEAKAEEPKPKKPALGLDEIEGEIKDGAKIRIGLLNAFSPTPGEKNPPVIVKPLIVPKKWVLRGPMAGGYVHAVDADRPEFTLCDLPTDWQSGTVNYDSRPDTPITCLPCARRLVVIKKITQAELDRRWKLYKEAQEKAAAEKAAAKQAKKDKKDKAVPTTTPVAAKPDAPTTKPVKADPKPAAKPDPKPSTTQTAA